MKHGLIDTFEQRSMVKYGLTEKGQELAKKLFERRRQKKKKIDLNWDVQKEEKKEELNEEKDDNLG